MCLTTWCILENLENELKTLEKNLAKQNSYPFQKIECNEVEDRRKT